MEVILAEKTDLDMLIEKVNDERDSYIIMGKNGKSIVALSINDYESIMETVYSLSSKVYSDQLSISMKKYEAGDVKSINMEKILESVK